MPIIKCKACGGDLIITKESAVCECEYCGLKQTIPMVKDEGLQNLYNRANVMRMRSEFDKAADIYEKIVQRDEKEAEAYWGFVLCKYGIEYVEDPVSFQRIPTCHRASFESVVSDDDYKNAVKFASKEQRAIYESEATTIDSIQKGIVALAQKEDSYDVFICYKETDESGKRTKDSVIANDIYHQLNMEGFKVFYAAITLEDKLGSEYEPYIFSALNSAKVMLVIGTSPEHFNAVWVKNEWSRYLKIIQKDRSKLLIPCYRDMDAYDLPEEFAHLQAQDMSKIGFINDIVRGIKKIIDKEPTIKNIQKQAEAPQIVKDSKSIKDNLEKGALALNDKDWKKADEAFDLVLTENPNHAEAYLGKFLAKERCSSIDEYIDIIKLSTDKGVDEILSAHEPDEEHISSIIAENAIENYLPADEIRAMYNGFDLTYKSQVASRTSQKAEVIDNLNNDRLFSRARSFAAGYTKTKTDMISEEIFNDINGKLEDAQRKQLAEVNRIKREYAVFLKTTDFKVAELQKNAVVQREADYKDAVSLKDKASSPELYRKAAELFAKVGNYRDAEDDAKFCSDEADRFERIQNRDKKRKQKKITIATSISAVVIISFVIVLIKFIIPEQNYKKAVSLMNSEVYDEAVTAFTDLGDYKDSSDKIKECYDLKYGPDFNTAIEKMNSGEYDEAIELFSKLNEYDEAVAKIEECENLKTKRDYDSAVTMMESGEYVSAIAAFEALGDYSDSADKLTECYKLSYGESLLDPKIGDTVYFGNYEQDNNLENGSEPIEWIVIDKYNGTAQLISKYALDTIQYNAEDNYVEWDSCTLRSWLNNQFYNTAFFEDEKALIELNSKYSDNVFALSSTEARLYFSHELDTELIAIATPYAISSGADVADGINSCYWWLSDYGFNDSNSGPRAVARDGNIVFFYQPSQSGVCVRPSILVRYGNADAENSGEPGTLHITSTFLDEMYWEWYGLHVGYCVSSIQDDCNCSESGIEVGDVITSINGYEINSGEDFYYILRHYNLGDTVILSINRDDEEKTIEVILDKLNGNLKTLSEESLDNIEVGDIVAFGNYEQDNNTSNGAEAIEWQVLEKNGNEVTLISKYALDCKEYNTSETDITWETCSLRTWLNGDFYNSAFSEDEKRLIETTNVTADKNPENDTDPGNATQDKVYLLSISEAEYYTTKYARVCVPTEYAKANGAFTADFCYTSDGATTCLWWLRSPGYNQHSAARVNYDGSVDYDGGYVSSVDKCVRPALTLNLES